MERFSWTTRPAFSRRRRPDDLHQVPVLHLALVAPETLTQDASNRPRARGRIAGAAARSAILLSTSRTPTLSSTADLDRLTIRSAIS
jgi:hypothetical protein